MKFILRFLCRNHLILQIIFISIICINIFFVVFSQPKKYTSDYWQRFHTLKAEYYDSQYATKHPTHGWISDALAYSYAGGALITGTNPILIIPDAPPLGKYLIGLSAVLFNNENIMTVIFAAFSLLLLFLVSIQVFRNITLALLPPFFWSFELLFKDQIVNGPLFDIFQLVFLLSAIYFFNIGYIKPKGYTKYIIISFLFLGFFISTKFFISGLIFIAATSSILLLSKQYNKIPIILLGVFMSIFVLLITYVRVFAFGYGIRQFLGIQKWIFLYHKSQIIFPFSIWPLILFNRWHVWFGKIPVIHDANWLITWPVITFLSFITIIFYIFKKVPQNKSIEIIMSWIFFYFLFFSFGEIFSRYFVIVIPLMYIVCIFTLQQFAQKYMKFG